MATDGLAAMFDANDAARRNARKVAPPRHPRKKPPVVVERPTDVVPAPAEPVVITPSAQPAPVAPSPVQPAAAPSTVARSVQLDEPAEDLLDLVRSAGRRQRVDANRSATIRLALRRMAEQLSPEQIAAELKKSTTSQAKGAGRRAL